MAKKNRPVSINATAKATVYGTSNRWSLSPFDSSDEGRMVDVRLAIQGNAKHGFHLVQSPDGFFTADSHSPTLDDALTLAQELYGIPASAWTET